jgi:transcriptional regulator with XRE-family HTH domain
MKLMLATVEDAGLAIRALRKHAGIRIDDFALTAQVSKQFMTDLENGKPTIQMGRALELLNKMGVRITLDLPDAVAGVLERERIKVQSRTKRRQATKPPSEESQ